VSNPLRNNEVVSVVRELADHGITRPQIEQTSKSIKIIWMQGQQRCMVVCSRTPSDHRGALNARATTRRLLRQRAPA
jgi:hypothetical protein